MAAAGSAASGPGSVLQLPTFATARALVKPGSCLSVGPHRRHVALAPRFLGRKRSGLREQLDRELLRYSESLRGVPVAYDNLRIVGELGDIYDDQGHVHLDVEADFVLFCPERGQRLVGTVNKVAPSHVGCLVHGCFNASVPKPEHVPAEQWRSLSFRVGDELEFEVARLDSDAAGVLCIRGKLAASSLPPALPTLPKGSGDIGDEPEPGAGGEKPKKKKSRKSLKHPPHEDCGPVPTPDDAPSDTAGAAEALNKLCEEQEPPQGKKNHHREKLEQDPLWHASDSSGYQSDHKEKKRKRKKHSDEPEGPVAPEEPRPKKKKKGKE